MQTSQSWSGFLKKNKPNTDIVQMRLLHIQNATTKYSENNQAALGAVKLTPGLFKTIFLL